MALWKLKHLNMSVQKKKEFINYLHIGLLPNLDTDSLFNLNWNSTVNTTYSPPFHPAKQPDISIDNYLDNSLFKQIIYTDGSSSKDGVGAGMAHYSTDSNTFIHRNNFHLAGHCTIMQAELYAIYKALNYVNNAINLSNSCTAIRSDSRAALLSLVNSKNGGNLQRLILNELTKTNNRVAFQWTRSHVGEIGNEEADRLAKEGASSSTIPEYDNIPAVATKHLIQNTVTSIWQRLWEEGDTGRTTYCFFPNIQNRLNLNHITINFITSQLFTNHGNFNSYLHRFGHCDTPHCQCDNTSAQNNTHLIFECNNFDHLRSHLFKTVIQESHKWPCELSALVNNKNTFSALRTFIEATGALDLRLNT
ncbi:uncharacterized protein [Centruroides vittatus]|uniref:uncharacterized protein n=1 Tax=Centruroides vittatus TaxID=120091 RepID=UPI00350FE92E